MLVTFTTKSAHGTDEKENNMSEQIEKIAKHVKQTARLYNPKPDSVKYRGNEDGYEIVISYKETEEGEYKDA